MVAILRLIRVGIFKGDRQGLVQDIEEITGNGFLVRDMENLRRAGALHTDTIVIIGIGQVPGQLAKTPGEREVIGIRFGIIAAIDGVIAIEGDTGFKDIAGREAEAIGMTAQGTVFLLAFPSFREEPQVIHRRDAQTETIGLAIIIPFHIDILQGRILRLFQQKTMVIQTPSAIVMGRHIGVFTEIHAGIDEQVGQLVLAFGAGAQFVLQIPVNHQQPLDR